MQINAVQSPSSPAFLLSDFLDKNLNIFWKFRILSATLFFINILGKGIGRSFYTKICL